MLLLATIPQHVYDFWREVPFINGQHSQNLRRSLDEFYMRIFLEYKLYDSFVNYPRSIFLGSQPLCTFVLVTHVSSSDLGIHYFVVHLLKFVNSSHSLLKERTSEILLRYFKFIYFSDLISVLRVSNHNVTFHDVNGFS